MNRDSGSDSDRTAPWYWKGFQTPRSRLHAPRGAGARRPGRAAAPRRAPGSKFIHININLFSLRPGGACLALPVRAPPEGRGPGRPRVNTGAARRSPAARPRRTTGPAKGPRDLTPPDSPAPASAQPSTRLRARTARGSTASAACVQGNSLRSVAVRCRPAWGRG